MYRFGGVPNRQHKHILQFVIYYCQQNRISDNYTQYDYGGNAELGQLRGKLRCEQVGGGQIWEGEHGSAWAVANAGKLEKSD